MNRLKHIKRTLRRNLRDTSSYPNAEFVLLDYNSTDGLEEWVLSHLSGYMKSGRLVYVKTNEPHEFHMAKAKNLAHCHATGDILCNLDADHYTGKNFAFHINVIMNININTIGRGPKKLPDSGGRIFISRENYYKLGGYDERYCGWGHEDTDFYERALHGGLIAHEIPNYFVEHIRHSDELRVTHMTASIEESALHNEKLLEEAIRKKTIAVQNNWGTSQAVQRTSASKVSRTRLICSTN